MTIESLDLRAAAMEAVRLLDDETSAASQQARRLLLNAFSAELPSAVSAALDADPAVQAALERIAADAETYYLVGSDGGPSETLLPYGDDERPIDDATAR